MNRSNTSKSCHVCIHWIALAESSQMSTYLPWFQSLFSFFASFCIRKISNSIRVKKQYLWFLDLLLPGKVVIPRLTIVIGCSQDEAGIDRFR